MKKCIDAYEALRAIALRYVDFHPNSVASLGEIYNNEPRIGANSFLAGKMANVLDAFAAAAKKPLIGREVGNVMGVRFLSYDGFPPGVVLCRSGNNAKLFRIKDNTIKEIE